MIFIDRNPSAFAIILDMLRGYSLFLPSNPILKQNILDDIDFYCLKGLLEELEEMEKKNQLESIADKFGIKPNYITDNELYNMMEICRNYSYYDYKWEKRHNMLKAIYDDKNNTIERFVKFHTLCQEIEKDLVEEKYTDLVIDLFLPSIRFLIKDCPREKVRSRVVTIFQSEEKIGKKIEKAGNFIANVIANES